jgi:hypothetical protein
MARSVHTYRVCRGAGGSGLVREARANGGLVPLDSVEAEIAPVAFRDHPDTGTAPRQKSRRAGYSHGARRRAASPRTNHGGLETMGR